MSELEEKLRQSRSQNTDQELQIKNLEDKTIELEAGLKSAHEELNELNAQVQHEAQIKEEISNDVLHKSIMYEELLNKLFDSLVELQKKYDSVMEETKSTMLGQMQEEIKKRHETAVAEMQSLKEDHKMQLEALNEDHKVELEKKTKEHELALDQKFTDGTKQGPFAYSSTLALRFEVRSHFFTIVCRCLRSEGQVRSGKGSQRSSGLIHE